MRHRRRARGSRSRARRYRKKSMSQYVSSGQRTADAEENTRKAKSAQYQTREHEGDLKKFAFHRLTSSSVPASQETGELLGRERKKGHLFSGGVLRSPSNFPQVSRSRQADFRELDRVLVLVDRDILPLPVGQRRGAR